MRIRGLLPAAIFIICTAPILNAASFEHCATTAADGTYKAPATFDALLACQEKAKKSFLKHFELEHGALPSEADWKRFDAAQRAEARGYLKHHPTTHRTISQKSAGDPNLQDLKAMLLEQSDGGKNGITPQMAQEILQYLQQKQGGSSTEMQELLNGVSADGAALSKDTMQKLQQAARAAKAQGLDLGVSPNVERELLAPDDSGSSSPNVN